MRAEYDFSKAERGKFYGPLDQDYTVHINHSDETIVSKSIPNPAEMIRKEREIRDVQLFMAIGEERLHQLASNYGLKWDEMSEEEREKFVDRLLHRKPWIEVEEINSAPPTEGRSAPARLGRADATPRQVAQIWRCLLEELIRRQ